MNCLKRIEGEPILSPFKEHLAQTKIVHERDSANGRAGVYLRLSLERKYPNAPHEWIWQYISLQGTYRKTRARLLFIFTPLEIGNEKTLVFRHSTCLASLINPKKANSYNSMFKFFSRQLANLLILLTKREVGVLWINQ